MQETVNDVQSTVEIFNQYALNPEKLPVRIDEMLRYVGYVKSAITKEDEEMAGAVIEETFSHVSPKIVYSRFSVDVKENGDITMPYGDIHSEKLAINLLGCKEIIIFAGTLGAEFDRFLKRAYLSKMSKAALLQGCGAAMVEALCDEFVDFLNNQLKKENKKLRPRFSPGFGDYPLENQKGIFSVLRPEKHIGLTLMNTLIMAPEKSVTAVIGIEDI